MSVSPSRSQLSMSQQVQPPNARMSPASRYHSNLKVLRRRDPSIISIFDQFSHVCVYHHNGKKWEKQGFEGSMFLYERESYPPYGFYILNRVGMDDYIQRLYPEDDITAHGGYLMLRSYPNFTTSRLDAIQPVPDKFSNVYAYTDTRSSAEKGESQTIGLWTFSTDGRESLHDVVLRLHSYIKENLPYPDQYRYGPGRPPPPNPHLRTAAAASAPNGEESEYSDSQGVQPSAPIHGLSELDKLFAKYLPQQQNPSIASSITASAPTSTSSMSVQSLFAALGGAEVPSTQAQAQVSQRPGVFPTPPPRTQSTGISLLDTIFASASAPMHAGPTSSQQQPIPTGPASTSSYLHPSTIQNTIPIHSPTPKSKALPPPQVLSQNVIGSLLGLATSRTPSAASSIASYSAPPFGAGAIGGVGGERGGTTSSPSHPSSRDGDNEDESHAETSSDGSGSAGGGLGAVAAHALGRSVPIQIRAPLQQQQPQVQASDPAFRTLGLGLGAGMNGQATSIHGDATPRPTFITNEHAQNLASSSTTAAASSGGANGTKPRNGRPLVPFEPNSELWPYPRQPLDESPNKSGIEAAEEAGVAEGEGEIIELDWQDMSALSDPDAFLRVQKQQQQLRNGVGAGGGKKQNGTGIVGVGEETTKGRKKKEKKKSKKERLEAVAREREAIEQSWDFPTTQQLNSNLNTNFDSGRGNGAGMMMNLNGKNVPIPVTFHEDSPPATPSPVRSPAPEVQMGHISTSSINGREEEVEISGSSSVNGSAKKKNRRKEKKHRAAGVTAAAVGQEEVENGPVQPDRALKTLLAGLSEQPEIRRPTAHERNVFVREVLTLIQTDPEFADTLWRKYYSQSA